MIMNAGLTTELEERRMERELMKGRKHIDEIGSRLRSFLNQPDLRPTVQTQEKAKVCPNDWARVAHQRYEALDVRPSKNLEPLKQPR
jgi:hypothetical protein